VGAAIKSFRTKRREGKQAAVADVIPCSSSSSSSSPGDGVRGYLDMGRRVDAVFVVATRTYDVVEIVRVEKEEQEEQNHRRSPLNGIKCTKFKVRSWYVKREESSTLYYMYYFFPVKRKSPDVAEMQSQPSAKSPKLQEVAVQTEMEVVSPTRTRRPSRPMSRRIRFQGGRTRKRASSEEPKSDAEVVLNTPQRSKSAEEKTPEKLEKGKLTSLCVLHKK
jgi:hypothetical protein